ncbi:hypothetical protein A7318_28085 (plasmid) [Pseudomonas lurida]|nr:hypothetical protein A7318_28085 [Pseudomonas lurida]
MGLHVNQFITGGNERELINHGQSGTCGKAGISCSTDEHHAKVAAAIYVSCVHLDDQQFDEIVEIVRLYKT